MWAKLYETPRLSVDFKVRRYEIPNTPPEYVEEPIFSVSSNRRVITEKPESKVRDHQNCAVSWVHVPYKLYQCSAVRLTKKFATVHQCRKN